MKKVRDHYFQKAKREGFAARSAFKLEQIDGRRGLLHPGQRVLDLGAAPGSWLQYAASRVGPQGRVVGVDLQPVTVALPTQVTVIQGDVLDPRFDGGFETVAGAGEAGAGPPFDVILSDMAPRTTGIPAADAARSADLARRALHLAAPHLAPGGALLVKVFQGAQLPALRREFQAAFERVTLEKPRASRAESVEVFLLGMGKKGG